MMMTMGIGNAGVVVISVLWNWGEGSYCVARLLLVAGCGLWLE